MQKRTKKRVWERGEKADVVAAIAEAYLKTSLTVSISDLCTIVQREICRQNLDIEISPSGLRGILTADKRKFNFLRLRGECMHLASETGLMADLLRNVSKKLQKTASEITTDKVRHLRSVPPPLQREQQAA